MKPAIQTKVDVSGRPIMIRVFDDYVELRRKGERSYRTLSISELWRLSSDVAPPPRTERSKNSIVAVFIGVKNGKSIWERQDTGEQMTEAKIMSAGRAERRPVVTLFGMPDKAKAAGL